MDLIRQLTDPTGLSVGDKLSGGLMVAVVGMSITFLALMFLWLTIEILSKLLNQKSSEAKSDKVAPTVTTQTTAPVTTEEVVEDDSEVVAVIMAALSATMNTSTNNIVVNKIVRIPDARTAWVKMGLISQMNDRG